VGVCASRGFEVLDIATVLTFVVVSIFCSCGTKVRYASESKISGSTSLSDTACNKHR
jgi:hypothetical protein